MSAQFCNLEERRALMRRMESLQRGATAEAVRCRLLGCWDAHSRQLHQAPRPSWSAAAADRVRVPSHTLTLLDNIQAPGSWEPRGLGSRVSSALDSGVAAAGKSRHVVFSPLTTFHAGNHVRETLNVGQRVTNTAEAWRSASSLGARAGVALEAVQGVSQVLAAGLALLARHP